MPEIRYDLKANTDQFEKGIGGAKGAMVGATNAAGALAAGVLALGAAVGTMIEDVTVTIDTVNTLAAATGLSNDAINGLRLAAKASGKELQDIVPRNLAKNMLRAADSGGSMAEAFQRLGVEFDNTDGTLRSATDVFGEMIQGLSEMENRTEAAAIADKVLAGAGKELLTAFEDQAGFQHFIDLGKEFGIRVGPDAVAATADWQTATANLSLAFETATQTFLDTIGGPTLAAGFVESFSLGFIFVTELAAATVEQLVANFGLVGDAIAAAFAGDLAGAQAIIGQAKGTQDAFDQAALKAYQFFEVTKNEAPEMEKALTDANKPLEILPGLAAEAEKAIKSLEAAEAKLGAIALERQSDQLDAEGRLVAEYLRHTDAIADQLDAVEELGVTGVEAENARAEAAAARFEAAERFNRDLRELETELAAERLEEQQEAADLEVEIWAEAQAGITDEAQKAADKRREIQQALTEYLQMQWETLKTTISTFHSLRMSTLEEEAIGLRDRLALEQAEVEALQDVGGAALETAEAKAEATEQELNASQDKLSRAFAASQVGASAQVAIDAAASVLALIPAFALLGPAAPAAALGVVAPVATAQLAVIASQQPPKIHDGTANVDEVLATLRGGEAVASQRGAETLGRDRIAAANRGLGDTGARVTEIVFQRRVLDRMVASTIQGGGRTRNVISRGRPAPGILDPFGGF